MTEEEKRLTDRAWRRWGPYLSERQWGTVREDYSANGEAWEYFPHDHARSRAYRWGEDGIAGICDDKQLLCFAIACWNGVDPIIKERLFGLTNHEGNHGEDVKEYAFYLDNIPSHAYMKYLYKYPQNEFPYQKLIDENRRRSRLDPEYELLDTGIFDRDEYFDIFVEYAKTDPEEILMKITVANRGDHAAVLHLLPTLWFRNSWSWDLEPLKPSLTLESEAIKALHPALGERRLYFDQKPKAVLFTENETNSERLFGVKNRSPFVKDGINNYIVHNNSGAVNPQNKGTKASLYYPLSIPARGETVIRLRLTNQKNRIEVSDLVFKKRIEEADEFYNHVTPYAIPDDMRRVQRQGFAGLLWNKQLYHYNVHTWIQGDHDSAAPESRKQGRNAKWKNVDAYDIFSMPDKWEYPWFASWDLAFHTVALAMIDPSFAKQQLLLLSKEWYMHPDGQLPAYEWEFGDVNPPVQAWAALRIYQIEGKKDLDFLKRIYHKLILNFTWWVNRKDSGGRNIFEGGFLGLDNIGVFDRSKGVPPGCLYEQCDGTGWMGMYCLNLFQIALELAKDDPTYEEMAVKFFEHFISIADAIDDSHGLWNEELGFYYGILIMPDGSERSLKYDTITGVIPLFAIIVKEAADQDQFPEFRKRFLWLLENRPELLKTVVEVDKKKIDGKLMFGLANRDRLRRLLTKILDERSFLSPYGIRSVSSQLQYSISIEGKEYTINYEPAEATAPLFGGNSNWRGPIWFPLNYLMIETLQKYDFYLGDDFKVECPTGSGNQRTLWEVTTELTHRLIKIFLKDDSGRRPVYGNITKFQTDPHWRDYILFHEYFHGDNGSGLGASHQTGWTGLIVKLIHQWGKYQQ